MKKYENFVKCFSVLESSEAEKAVSSEIYRTGVVGQFNLTFELAWKALQETMRAHKVKEAETGSPREILKLGYKTGFINHDKVWIDMLNCRNVSIHIYNEEEIDEIVKKIYSEYIPEFRLLCDILQKKIKEAEETSWE